jgi:hypothetical protein
MSHTWKSGVTYTRVTPFKMVCLILDTERCGGSSQIDVATDVYVEVSRAMCIGVTYS